MRYLLAALLVLPFCLVASPSAQDAPDVDVLNLYKLVGRSWTVRVVTWNRGKPAQTEYRKQEVTLVHEDLCTVKTSILDKDGFLSGGDQARDLSFNDELKAASTPAKDAPKSRVAAAGASFECTLSENNSAASHEQTWRSTKFPALIVRQRIVRADYVQTLDLLSFNEGVPDAWTLYRMAGRKWVFRVNEELTGPNPKTSYLVHEVVESTLEGAKVKISHLDKEKKPVEGDLGDTITIDFEKSTPWKKPEKAKDQDVIEGTLSVARIKWASIEVRGSDQSEFYSKNWPGLLLKKTLKNSEMVLEEFYTGHDEMKFYRTKGNVFTLRNSYRFGGRRMGDSTSYQRMEVTAVTETQATYRNSSLDQNGRQMYGQESTMPLNKATPRMHAGDEPIEERVYTAAGTYQCLKQTRDSKDNKYSTWMHHGLTLRMLNEAEGYTMQQEVTELKLQ
ncbi:hypothetical protein PLCT2_01831 [Planctomycetaceae bacterium]|nr:hypothetical protein PLCT2_01831 [Planctomycetaceae bacterium]